MKTQQSANEQVIVVLLALLFLGLMCAWQGYVLSVLWGWFFVPTFGVPALSVPSSVRGRAGGPLLDASAQR